jgi:hypothetical protein
MQKGENHASAKFLRMARKFFKINDIDLDQVPCSQSYQQNMWGSGHPG